MSKLRFIYIASKGSHSAKVYRDSDWQEYRVLFTLSGTPLGPDSSYHTGDKQDALDTAISFVDKAYREIPD